MLLIPEGEAYPDLYWVEIVSFFICYPLFLGDSIMLMYIFFSSEYIYSAIYPTMIFSLSLRNTITGYFPSR